MVDHLCLHTRVFSFENKDCEITNSVLLSLSANRTIICNRARALQSYVEQIAIFINTQNRVGDQKDQKMSWTQKR